MPGIHEITYPTPRAASAARAAARAIADLLADKRGAQSIAFTDGHIKIYVPREAFELFNRVLVEMAKGNAVNVLPLHAEITTQQAAELLNVSRPYVIKLLNEKHLPYRMVGTHRRIRFEDLKRYKDADDRKRKNALRDLTTEAEALGLDY